MWLGEYRHGPGITPEKLQSDDPLVDVIDWVDRAKDEDWQAMLLDYGS
jgi:hypothetical protein